MCVAAQNAFWREVDCPMGGAQPSRSAGGPLRPMTTFAEVEHREHIIVREHFEVAPSDTRPPPLTRVWLAARSRRSTPAFRRRPSTSRSAGVKVTRKKS